MKKQLLQLWLPIILRMTGWEGIALSPWALGTLRCVLLTMVRDWLCGHCYYSRLVSKACM